MARSFNGTTDMISVASGFSIGLPISISLWIKTAGPPANTAITQSTVETGFTLGINATRTMFVARTGQAIVTTDVSPIPNDSWTQIGITYDTDLSGSAYAFYIGGSINGNGNAGSSITSQNGWVVNQFVAGSMADVGIWDILLTPGEMESLGKGARPYQIRQNNLKNYLPIDGIQSSEPDLSGNANNGTLTGTAFVSGPPITLFTPKLPLFLPSAAAILAMHEIGANFSRRVKTIGY